MTRTAHRASINITRPRADAGFVTASRFERRGWQALAGLGALAILVGGWLAAWVALPL